jgi:D-alanyl-D-alanine carboxypeptidase/D-alanyl-D-alanine-endopeptidase (penicillin-binding protein 4)
MLCRVGAGEGFRVACAAWVLVLAATVGSAAQQGSLNDEVARAAQTRKLGQARVGICIRDVDHGITLADFHAEEAFTPASNMKLLTSGGALMVLSPEFRFQTRVVLDGERLVVIGSGDPALADAELLARMTPKMTVGDCLSVIIGAVNKAGVRSVKEVVVDDRIFDRQFVHPTWAVDKLDRGYSAEVAGLNFHSNVISVYPRPSPDGAGGAPQFSIEPEAPFLPFENRAKTVTEGKNTVWISRDPNANRFVLRGEVRSPAQTPVQITVHDPPEFFARLLAHYLSKAGITVESTARVCTAGEVFDSSRVLAVISTPMDEVLQRCNSDSANLYAECLLKRLGQAVTGEPGSWANGGAVLRMVLAQNLGAAQAASVIVADGSGLSRENSVSPMVLAKWLEVMARDARVRDAFTESMATPGKGTLRNRFREVTLSNNLYAKSGFINGVRSLSGYIVHPASGRRLAFSVIVNDIKTDAQTLAALELHETIVKIADQHLKRMAAEEARVGG